MLECSFCHDPAQFQLVRSEDGLTNVLYMCKRCKDVFTFAELHVDNDEGIELIPTIK